MIYYSDTFNTWSIPQAELSKLRRTYEQYQKVNPIFINYERHHDRRTGYEPDPEEYQDLHSAKWYVTERNYFKVSAFPKGEGPYTIDELYQFVKKHNLKCLNLIKG